MQLAVITDEISEDLSHALRVCQALGISQIELRSVNGASIVDHDVPSVRRMAELIHDGGFQVCAIASPFLKTHIGEPTGSIGATHSAQDLTREQHWDVLKRSIEVAYLLNAPIVRAFSFWRVPHPEGVREDVLQTLGQATEIVRDASLKLGLENEHACNIGDGLEAKWYLDRLTTDAIGLIWDPGNIAALGNEPNKAQYDAVADRIIHVHVKDGNAIPATEFVLPGTGVCDWVNQLRLLQADGYNGALSIESHMDIDGSREAGTRAIAIALRELIDAASERIS